MYHNKNADNIAHGKAIELDPRNAAAYNSKGQVLKLQGKYEDALQAFEEAIELATATDNIAASYFNKGLVLVELGRYLEALDVYYKAAQNGPKNVEYGDEIFRISKKVREMNLSGIGDVSLSLSQSRAEACANKGHTFFKAKRFVEALQTYDSAIVLGTKDAQCYINLGSILVRYQHYEEAIRRFTQAIQLNSCCTSAYFGKGNIFVTLARYDEALQAFDAAIQCDPHLASVHVARGHTLLGLNRQEDALKSYKKAIDLHSNDALCYSNSGDIFSGLHAYEEAVQMYQQAIQREPQLISACLGLSRVLFELNRNADALVAYIQAWVLDKKSPIALQKMRDIVASLLENDNDLGAYKKALGIIAWNEQTSNKIWRVAILLHSLKSPVAVQFALFQLFIVHTPLDRRIHEAFKHLGTLYQELFDADVLPTHIFHEYLAELRNLLLLIPEGDRSNALAHIGTGHNTRIAQLLIHLAPFSIPGLSSLAHEVTLHWVPSARNDNLVYRFYDILDTYAVPDEDADWFYARQLIMDGMYVQARPVLEGLLKAHPVPERIWLLATAMQHCDAPAQEQIELLHQFIASDTISNGQRGEAWKRIGELTQGMASIEAFQEAEHCGCEIPQLALYRAGEWEALPALHLEPDCAFPTVVVLDLENDYQPDLPDVPDGSRVFEISAVRMRGHTELATCNWIIKRDFPLPEKVAHLQDKAIEPKEAAEIFQKFIGTSIIVGHNIEAFDAKQLRGMNVQIDGTQIIDTLTFARLLYPDSVHHHLGLLCHKHGISFQGEQHRSLPDAKACADLLLVLGDELTRRSGELLAGFRALVPPDSAFDRAILQPRGVPVDPSIPWDLDPAPAILQILMSPQEAVASHGLVAALEQKTDAFVERYDPSGAYIQHLPERQRAVVLVETRSRLERMIAQSQGKLDLFVLPDSHTLLCPYRLRQSIEQAQDWQTKLALFCLYQASHNHDARTLYPVRLPDSEDAIKELRQILLTSCCASEWHHPENCPGILAVQAAIENHRVILATHENYLRQLIQPKADIIIVDDADQLQMHFAEYLAGRITSEQVRNWSPEAFILLNRRIEQYANDYMSDLGFHGRVPLRQIVPFLTQLQGDESKTIVSQLRVQGRAGEEIAIRLEQLCQQALQEETIAGNIYAYWLELSATRQPVGKACCVEQWSICGLNQNLPQAFERFFLSGYKQHIICGATLSLGKRMDKPDTTFLTQFFQLPAMVFVVDPRPPSNVYIPLHEEVRSASFLNRRTWAKSVGTFLNRLTKKDWRSLVVSLQTSSVANALTDAFSSQEIRRQTQRQVLSTHRNWTTAKIAERLADPERRTLAFISPRLRKTVLDGMVDIEATGPLRFLNQQDPLTAAHMRLYDRLYKREQKHPFDSYLLPQALLELKARLSSPARIHAILDSGLQNKVYWEKVKELFEQDTILDTLPGIAGTTQVENGVFSSALERALESYGFHLHIQVDDETLHQTLRTFWQIDSFREAPLNQKEIVQAILNHHSPPEDQLVIAATGGGKSLCYQLPAILLAQDNIPKVTLVISPLIALMNDQVAALRKNGVFSAIAWNSTLSSRQHYLEGIRRGWYSLIYAAPEQIHFPALRAALQARDIGLVAIDEAHCVSQWGHNFRTEYFALKNWIETQLCAGQPREFPIIALTATARNGYKDEQGTVQDIINGLGLRLQANRIRLTSPERLELDYSVEPIAMSCLHCHTSLGVQTGVVICPACHQSRNIDAKAVEETKIEKLISLLADKSEDGLRRRWDRPYGQRQRGLIYCTYAKSQEHMNVEGVAERLQADPRLADLRVGAYHAQMADRNETLREVYNSFTSDDGDGLDVVVATNAFGMGIDVRRLGFVIHFDTPGTLEAYIQEAGRAGRDAEFRDGSKSAHCILFYHEHDLENQSNLSDLNKIDEREIMNVYDALLKCKRRGEQEIFVTTNEIKRLAGLKDKQEGKINAALYYLEYHTLAHAKPVLVRDEDVPVSSLLAFEQQRYRPRLSPDSEHLQRKLIHIFQKSEQYRLREQQVSLIDLQALAEDIGEEKDTLSRAIRNLVGKHILAYAQRLPVLWLKSKAQSCELVTQVEHDIVIMLQNVQDQQGLRYGKSVVIDLGMLDQAKKRLAANLPLPVFADFLSDLARPSPAQLFDYFVKISPGCYRFRLKSYDPSLATCRDICERLRQVIRQYDAPDSVGKDWLLLDMLMKEADPMQRSQSGQMLRLLEKLQILSLDSSGENENAMRIVFQQDNVSPDQLTINLKRLHLVEQYNERKLELMREYVTMSSRQERLSLIKRYFAGEMPLLEPFIMRPDLTEQQQAIVSISEGYHLIEGPAGSGKTTILEEHVRYLIEHELVSPDRILVVTHFNSAVDRIANNVNVYQKNGQTIRARTLNRLAMSIFSQNRQLLLRPDGQQYYTDEAKLEAIQGNWREIESKECNFLQEVLVDMRKQNLHPNWSRPNMADKCLKAIKVLRQHGIFPLHPIDNNIHRLLIKVLRQHGNFPPRPIDDNIHRLLSRLEDQKWIDFVRDVHLRYLTFLGKNGRYTYDDQILFALAILQANRDIARTYQRLYEHIIIDEFQDLTDAELQLIGILSQKYRNVKAFGDDAQDIRVKTEQDNRPVSMKSVQWTSDPIGLGDLDDHPF